jgi:hypothetical protein
VSDSARIGAAAYKVDLTVGRDPHDGGVFRLRDRSGTLVGQVVMRGGRVTYGEVRTPTGAVVCPFWPNGTTPHEAEVTRFVKAIESTAA